MYGEPPRACHCHQWPSFIARAKELGRFGNVLNSKIRRITVVKDEDGDDIEVSQEKAKCLMWRPGGEALEGMVVVQRRGFGRVRSGAGWELEADSAAQLTGVFWS